MLGLFLRNSSSRLIKQNLSVTYHINQRHYQGRHINYYDILGVRRHSDMKEVKVAYFKMAKKFHPDTNRTLDAKQMFELIAEAYDVLSDEKKRNEYDETGCVSDRHGGRSAHGPGRQSTDSSYTAEQMYSKIFNTKESSSHQGMAYQDYATNTTGWEVTREFIINMTAVESICGLKTQIPIFVTATCDKCQGSRSELGYQANVCPYCEGTGEETIRTGHIVGRKQCSYCHGEKLFTKFKCIECEGIGKKLYDIAYPIVIPPGCEHGQVLRYELDPVIMSVSEEDHEKGQCVYVTINVDESPFFSRHGMDLSSYIRLSPGICLLGGKLDYVGMTAQCDLNIEPCTSSHATIVVHRGGVHSPAEAGDHYLTTLIKVPKKLTWRQRKKITQFAELDTDYLGTIDGVPSDSGHKFEHNLVHASRIRNTLLHKCLFNEDNLSWTQQLIKMVKELRNRLLRSYDPTFRQEDSKKRGDNRTENREFGV